jgi:hypothetical protein
MANRVYRGPVTEEPATVTGLVDGALLPATIVKFDGTDLSQAAATDDEARLLVLNNNDYNGQDILTAYSDNDTGAAYRIKPEQEFQVAMAAGTYAFGDALTVAASGRLAVAASGDAIIAYFDQAGGTLNAGDLADVVIANRLVKA